MQKLFPYLDILSSSRVVGVLHRLEIVDSFNNPSKCDFKKLLSTPDEEFLKIRSCGDKTLKAIHQLQNLVLLQKERNFLKTIVLFALFPILFFVFYILSLIFS